MTLTKQLQELAEGSKERHPGEAQEIMKTAIDVLKQEKLTLTSLKTGDVLPTIILPNAMGFEVSIDKLLKSGKVVLVFYRGGWCPYCNLALKAYQEILPQIKEKGAALVAISPEAPDNALTTKQNNELQFEVLSDIDNKIAKKLRLRYTLPNSLVSLYSSFGINLESSQQNKDNALPIAATYVINEEGIVSYHFLEEDYKLRADPKEILAHL